MSANHSEVHFKIVCRLFFFRNGEKKIVESSSIEKVKIWQIIGASFTLL